MFGYFSAALLKWDDYHNLLILSWTRVSKASSSEQTITNQDRGTVLRGELISQFLVVFHEQRKSIQESNGRVRTYRHHKSIWRYSEILGGKLDLTSSWLTRLKSRHRMWVVQNVTVSSPGIYPVLFITKSYCLCSISFMHITSPHMSVGGNRAGWKIQQT